MNDSIPTGYRALSPDEIAPLLALRPELCDLLGGDPSSWQVRDVADGNINAVYLVEGPQGGVCVKQALPWLRVAGASWPLPVERAFFENAYMRRVEPIVGALAPRWLHFDPELHMIVMERLQPHVVLRPGLIRGGHFPGAAAAVADYVAAVGFHTSDLAQPFERKFTDQTLFARNVALQRITVDLVFTDPYIEAPRNRWATPWLDDWAAALRNDLALRSAVARHRLHYLTHAQALIHGDLHTGSVMVTEHDTRVIDGEFAMLGPIGFDLGAFIANLVMAWFAKPGHAASTPFTDAYRRSILDQVVGFWQRFDTQFLGHWSAHRGPGDAFPASHFNGAVGQARLGALQREYVAQIYGDTLAYAGIEIIRRIVGFAHLADFLAIDDLQQRAHAQAGALALARDLLLQPERFADIASLVDAVPRYEGYGLDPTRPRRT
jgi:5-methylthioribose kinase